MDKTTNQTFADVQKQHDGTFRLAGYEPPKDHIVTFTGDGKETVLHIPFKDLHTVAILLNEFLQSKGIESTIEKKAGW